MDTFLIFCRSRFFSHWLLGQKRSLRPRFFGHCNNLKWQANEKRIIKKSLFSWRYRLRKRMETKSTDLSWLKFSSRLTWNEVKLTCRQVFCCSTDAVLWLGNNLLCKKITYCYIYIFKIKTARILASYCDGCRLILCQSSQSNGRPWLL